MKKVFDIGFLDTSKRPMVEGEIVKQIKDYQIHLSIFRQEIDFWFNLLEKTNQFEKRYIRKPICIELFEYAHYMQWLKNDINKVCRKVNKIFNSKGRSSPLTPLERKISKTINNSIKYLRDPRNQFAAHRYTKKKSKEFITVDNVIKILNKISDKKLVGIRDQLFACDELIALWINSNKNYLILASKC
jgi:hypothetical protein